MPTGLIENDVVALRHAGIRLPDGTWLFRDLNLRIAPGQRLCLLGGNGRGKTTLLRAIAGLTPLDEGSVCVTPALAYLPQRFHCLFDYGVVDMVLMGRCRHLGLWRQPGATDHARALDALQTVGMQRLAARSFRTLSGGERQLVLLARALVSEPRCIVLDEPASALDLANQSLLLALLARLAHQQGISTLFSSHHPQHALDSDCQVLVMRADDLPLHGDARTVLTEPVLSALYGLPVRRIDIHNPPHHHTGIVPLFPSATLQQEPCP